MRPIDGDELKKLIIEKYSDIAKQKSFIAACVSVAVRTICMMIEIAPTLTLGDLRPKGRWVIRGGRRYCSHCGERACVTRDREDFWYTKGTQFCPNCGADMRGGGEEVNPDASDD